MFAPRRNSYDKPKECIKNQRHHFDDKGPYSQSYGFSSSHVWMWALDDKEGWALKNWCFQNLVLRRLLRVPWTARRSNQSILKEISPEYSLEELMLKLKLQCLSHLKSLLIGKDPEAEKDWRQKKEGAAEDEMVRKHFYSIDINLSKLKDSREQRSLACYSTQSCKESDDLVTERQQHGLNCVLLPQIHWLKS